MKTTRVVILSFIVFVFSTNQLLAVPEAVLDNDGEELIASVDYFILPVFRGNGGGLTNFLNRNGSLCPPDVIQADSELDRGRRVTFFPENPENKVIQTQTNVNILFSGLAFCRERFFMWKLDEIDQTFGHTCVTTERFIIENQEGPNTLNNWFRIEKIIGTTDYKIVSCSCNDQCTDLGIFFDSNEVRHLCLSDKPLKVFFVKANTITTSSD